MLVAVLAVHMSCNIIVNQLSHDDMTKIFEASMVLRKLIEQAKIDPWVFNGMLENSLECSSA